MKPTVNLNAPRRRKPAARSASGAAGSGRGRRAGGNIERQPFGSIKPGAPSGPLDGFFLETQIAGA